MKLELSAPTAQAAIRSVADTTIQRHFEELIDAGLLTKEERSGQTNIQYIENVSEAVLVHARRRER